MSLESRLSCYATLVIIIILPPALNANLNVVLCRNDWTDQLATWQDCCWDGCEILHKKWGLFVFRCGHQGAKCENVKTIFKKIPVRIR